ncbi:MAG: class I SAM-dependent methyltransferase [Syntrophobacteraceae bacterium]|jgi:cyclopropane-fatty-acyl-phospholipid synthase|nr:class I SAM-dependent methyltransferase [Syntrophobacteraceae bacterium]
MKRTFEQIADRMHRSDPSAGFAIRFWDGTSVSYGNGSGVTLHIKSEKSAAAVLAKGFLGFGEEFTAGGVEVEGDLQELCRLALAIKFDGTSSPLLRKLRFLPVYLKTRDTENRAARNISRHYDLGNDFFTLYLDPSMTYSCAYFRSPHDSLEQAQQNKYEHICRKLMLKPGETLLDIGCGWGGMLIYAARKYRIKGVGNTLSTNQFEYSHGRIRELGLDHSISIALADYRKLTGQFDKIVSIGMFEHVGKEFIPVFMKTISRLLKPGGLGLLHTIGTDADSYGETWACRYIFPGGYIPKLSEIIDHMGNTGFSILDVENLRLHYARTLDLWAENFEKNIDRVRQMFDDTFVRMWKLYLHSASAGFKHGDNRVYQILFSNGLNNDLPWTREGVYRTA